MKIDLTQYRTEMNTHPIVRAFPLEETIEIKTRGADLSGQNEPVEMLIRTVVYEKGTPDNPWVVNGMSFTGEQPIVIEDTMILSVVKDYYSSQVSDGKTNDEILTMFFANIFQGIDPVELPQEVKDEIITMITN